jgi:2-iminobutanoate/2-iminopropanoate deaminase
MPAFEVILSDRAPTPSGGYSQALRWGNMIVTSNCLGTLSDGSGLVHGGFAAETRQALDNLRAVLEAAGSSMDDVVRVNVSLIDVARYADMDHIFCEYFSEPHPTRSTVGVKELWGGAQVSFDAWAVVRTE